MIVWSPATVIAKDERFNKISMGKHLPMHRSGCRNYICGNAFGKQLLQFICKFHYVGFLRTNYSMHNFCIKIWDTKIMHISYRKAL